MEGLPTGTTIFEIVGMISACSFLIIAVGDFLAHCASIIVAKVFAPKETPFARKVVFAWDLMKALYEEFRTFLDKLSAYSRPRHGSNSASTPLAKEGPKT